MSDDPEFSERARAFMDAQGRERLHTVEADQYDFDPSKYPDVATLAELKQLMGEREVPRPAPAPGGLNTGDMQQAVTAIHHEREERIRYLQDRLGQEQEHFETRFDQAIEIER